MSLQGHIRITCNVDEDQQMRVNVEVHVEDGDDTVPQSQNTANKNIIIQP